MTPQLNELSALGASVAVKVPYGTFEHTYEAWFTHRAIESGKITAVTLQIQGSLQDDGKNGIVNTEGPVLAIGSTAERYANGVFTYRIADVNYNKAAVAAGTVFSSAHTVTASKFGVINIYIDSAGTFLTLSAKLGDDQTAALASDNAEDALDAADDVPLPAGYCYVGRILIENGAGLWTANTDDLTDASDVTTATFLSVSPPYDDLYEVVFNAEQLVRLRKTFTVSHTYYKYTRIYLSVLTGTGLVYVLHTPITMRVR